MTFARSIIWKAQKIWNTTNSNKGTKTKYVKSHLSKVMEVLYIISFVCVSVGAYDTIKQHHAIKQLDKQLKQSLIIK